ncbi:carbohydrate-binding family 9-like protein, partial [Candidatus Latescibacterota bacterium]
VKLLWNDIFLYVSYKCDDKHIWADHYNTNANTYEDDCVELFWNPNPEGQERYNMFEMNAIGNLLSVYTGSGVSIHERVSRIMVPHMAQTIQGTVNNDDDIDTGWIIEIAVRFSDYPELSIKPAPEPGDMWRIGLNRLGGKTNPQHSQWSSEQGEKPSFHTPKFFGKIFFSDEIVQ